MEYVIPVTRADSSQKAFQQGNYQSQNWTQLWAQVNPPGPVSFTGKTVLPVANPIMNNGLVDGIYAVGESSQYSPVAVELTPYCQGLANTNFSMRVYGWKTIGLPDGQARFAVWYAKLLAEFTCWACNSPGPFTPSSGVTPAGKMGYDENFCDTIVLAQGALGPTGWIDSTGARDQGNAGTDLIASVTVELRGAKYLQFDFAPIDQMVPCNCFWAFQ